MLYKLSSVPASLQLTGFTPHAPETLPLSVPRPGTVQLDKHLLLSKGAGTGSPPSTRLFQRWMRCTPSPAEGPAEKAREPNILEPP